MIAVVLLNTELARAQAVDYLRDVKPILAAHCYTCHGAIKQKAGLRLDTVAQMKEGGDRGTAFDTKDIDQSLLLKHVRADKGFKRMPPEQDGEALKPAQIAILRRWIEQGAVGPKDEMTEADPRDHWAFRPPLRSEVPKVKNAAWVRNPIDAFIAAEHEKRGLTPQPPTERGVLLRRVYLDLIGLPPTREEQQAFLADKSPNAYEKVVDRLLASPQYGERWGRHWMDIWRYSDWWGLGAELRNSQRHIWHWRDWIVESLNKDKGYDRMLLEMLAADELYPTDADALRGTGFLARHYFLFNRTTWLDETIEHTGKAFLGLTLNCCKCHDHKYDAFTQADYYRFRAIFEPYQIRMDNVPGEIDVTKNGMPRVYDAHLDAMTYLHVRGNESSPDKNRKIVPGLPSLLLPNGLQIKPIQLPAEAYQPGLRPFVLEDLLRAAEKQRKDGEAELAKAKADLGKAGKKKELDSYGFKATSVEDTDRIMGTIRDRKLVFELANVVPFAKWPKDVTAEERKLRDDGLALLKRRLAEFDKRFVSVKGIDKRKTYRGDLTLVHTGTFTPGAPLTLGWFIVHLNCMLIEEGYSIYHKDGPELFFDDPDLGVPKKGRDALYKEAEAYAVKNKKGIWQHDELAKKLKALSKQTTIGSVKSAGPPTEKQARAALRSAENKIAHADATIVAIKARAAADRASAEVPSSGAAKKLARTAALAEKTQTLELAHWNLARVEGGEAVLKITPAQAKAAVDAARKALENPGETYTPLAGALKTLESNLESDANRRKPFPKESTGRRAAFAQWVADRNNPLTARVAVNHIWTRHFGQPLVATVFDFGRKGAAPTHPALLDWLAVEMMDNGWSMKHVHRVLVTSNTYRLSSSSLGASEKNLKDDPENRLTWRMNPQRMESQVVRDSLLHLAGELDRTLGGPSIETPQQDASKRRSLYFFHSAIERNKFLSTFDEADPLDCYRRRDSIIPQQALALSNSKLAGSMAEKIAARLEKAVAPQDFARESFACILGYAPTVSEISACEQAMTQWVALNKLRPDAERRARAQLIQVLLNHNDYITIR